MPLIRRDADNAGSARPAAEWANGLISASPDERWAAARAAAGDPKSVSALAKALSSESEPRVREAIFTALARIASDESAAAVTSYLHSDEAGLRIAALDAMRLMPGPTERCLPKLLADPDTDVRLLACDLARVVPGDAAVRLLLPLLENETQPNVCAAAVEVLAEVGDESAIAPLQRCAARHPADPFLAFAVTAAVELLRTP